MRSRGVLCGVSLGATLILLLGVVASAQGQSLDAVIQVDSLQEPRNQGIRLLQSEVVASGQKREAPEAVSEGGTDGLSSSPLDNTRKEQNRVVAEISEGAYEDDEEWSDDEPETAPTVVSKADAVISPAPAPAIRALNTGAFAPAPGPGSADLSGVKRYVSSHSEAKEEDDLKSEAPSAGNDTQSNRSLNDTRNEVVGVKTVANKPSPPLAQHMSNGTAQPSETESSTSEGVDDESDDDEGGSDGTEDKPPRLSHRTSSWEGFGDPSKKLTLVVVCSNVGGGILDVKVVIPTWIRADPESVKVAAGEERNITITVLDPKGLKSSSERIQIQSNGGDEYFEITSAALGRTDWTDGLPGSGSGTTTLFVAGFACIGLAVLGLWVWRRRRQRHGGAGFKYKEIEMQGDRDLSSALGQLPAGAGMAMSYSAGYGGNRGSRTPTGDDSNRGWDDNWDDWDEEEQRSKR